MTQDARQAAEATDYAEKARELARTLVFEAPSTLDGNKVVAFCTPRILAALQSAHAAGLAQGDAVGFERGARAAELVTAALTAERDALTAERNAYAKTIAICDPIANLDALQITALRAERDEAIHQAGVYLAKMEYWRDRFYTADAACSTATVERDALVALLPSQSKEPT